MPLAPALRSSSSTPPPPGPGPAAPNASLKIGGQPLPGLPGLAPLAAGPSGSTTTAPRGLGPGAPSAATHELKFPPTMHGSTKKSIEAIDDLGWAGAVIAYLPHKSVETRKILDVAYLMKDNGKVDWPVGEPPDPVQTMRTFQELSGSGELHTVLQGMLNVAQKKAPDEQIPGIVNLGGRGVRGKSLLKRKRDSIPEESSTPVAGSSSRLSFDQPATGPMAPGRYPASQAHRKRPPKLPGIDPKMRAMMLADAAKAGIEKWSEEEGDFTPRPIWERFLKPYAAQFAEHGLAWKDLKTADVESRDHFVNSIIGMGSDDATMALREEVQGLIDSASNFITTTTLARDPESGKWLIRKT